MRQDDERRHRHGLDGQHIGLQKNFDDAQPSGSQRQHGGQHQRQQKAAGNAQKAEEDRLPKGGRGQQGGKPRRHLHR